MNLNRGPRSTRIIALFIIITVVAAITPFLLPEKEKTISKSTEITISFNWPGATAETIEMEVTANYEAVISTLAGIKHISSISTPAQGNIVISTDQFVNVDQLRYEISTVLRALQREMPEGVSLPQVSVNDRNEASHPIYKLLLLIPAGKSLDKSVRAILEDNLSGIPGIKLVVIPQTQVSGWKISLDRMKMQHIGISAQQVLTTIEDFGKIYHVGSIDFANSELKASKIIVKTDVLDYDLRTLPLALSTGEYIRLDQVASITVGGKRTSGFHRINGFQAVVIDLIGVESSATIELEEPIKKIKAALPADFHLSIQSTQSKSESHASKTTFILGILTLLFLVVGFLCLCRSYFRIGIFIICMALLLILIKCIEHFLQTETLVNSVLVFSLVTPLLASKIINYEGSIQSNNWRVFSNGTVTEGVIVTSLLLLLLSFLDRFSLEYSNFLKLLLLSTIYVYLLLIFFLPSIWVFKGKFPQDKSVSLNLKITYLYSRATSLSLKFKLLAAMMFLLMLGTPFFLLNRVPVSKWDGNKAYDSTLGNPYYIREIKPWLDGLLGGFWYIFYQSQLSMPKQESEIQPPLEIQINLPVGSMDGLMNSITAKIENYLLSCKSIREVEVVSGSTDLVKIKCWFYNLPAESTTPLQIKGNIQAMAANTGLAHFSISGWGIPFDNSGITNETNYALVLGGYNYKEMQRIGTEVMALLKKNPRVMNVEMNDAHNTFNSEKQHEVALMVGVGDPLFNQRLGSTLRNHISNHGSQTQKDVFFQRDERPEPIYVNYESLVPDMWSTLEEPIQDSLTSRTLKLKDAIKNVDMQTISFITREDQEYKLVISYKYLGDLFIGSLVSDRTIASVTPTLPTGYALSKKHTADIIEDQYNFLTELAIFILMTFLLVSILLNKIMPAFSTVIYTLASYTGYFIALITFKPSMDLSSYQVFVIGPVFLIPGIFPWILSGQIVTLSDSFKTFKEFCRLRFMGIVSLIPLISISPRNSLAYSVSVGLLGGMIFSVIVLFLLFPRSLSNNSYD